jgi:pyrroline-5-carboxylate reductase
MSDHQLLIGFIGGGNMARAIITGLLGAGHQPSRLWVADPSDAQRKMLRALDQHVRVCSDNLAVAESAEVLVLAVKPQLMQAVVAGLHDAVRPQSQLVVSIAAGITLASLSAWLQGHTAVVRVMPNQPALVGAGMSILTASADTGLAQRHQAQYVAEAMGSARWVEDETLMDAVTAISGSGPAYFYLLMEIMEDCAREMGLPAELARTLPRETGFGAGRVARQSRSDLAELRAGVTSPGGTTEAALAVLESADFRDIFRRALQAARDRSVELGKPPRGG